MSALEAALELHKTLNCNVFPLPRCSKAPARSWKEFQRRKLTEDEIVTLFEREADANIAVVCGKISNLLVLDCDAQEALKRLGKGVPVTPFCETARGQHYYFSLQNATIRSVTSLADGLDVRGEGGYVVAPPSIHPSGKVYEWVIPPTEAEPAPCPAWLFEMLKRHRARPKADTVADIVRGVPEGYRNVSAAQMAGKLLGAFNQSDWETVVWRLLRGWNLQNRPPLSEKQLHYTFECIARKEAAKRRDAEDKISKVLRVALANSKLSRREIARLAGVSKSTVSRLASIATSTSSMSLSTSKRDT